MMKTVFAVKLKTAMYQCFRAVALAACVCCAAVCADETDDMEEIDKIASPMMSQLIRQQREGKYDAALKTCESAIGKLKKMKESSYRASQIAMFTQYRNEQIYGAIGKQKLAAARAHYQEGVDLAAKNPKKARRQISLAKSEAEEVIKTVPTAKLEAQQFIAACDATLDSAAFFSFDPILRNEIKKRSELLAKEIDPILVQSKKSLKEKKVAEVISLLDKADSRLAEMAKRNYIEATSPVVLLKKSEIQEIRTDVRREWFAQFMSNARKEFGKASDLVFKNHSEATVKANAAMQIVNDARKNLPEYADDFNSLEDACKRIVKTAAFKTETSLEEQDPSRTDRQTRIKAYYREAEVYYKNKLYAKARDVLEQVLILDPYNEKALFLLNKVYRKIINVAQARRNVEILERMNENEWKWNQSFLPRDSRVQVEEGPVESTASELAVMYDRLQSIIVPEIDFRGHNLLSAVKYLKERSKQYDKEGKGVNLVLAPGNDTDMEVTLKLTNIPIGKVIRYLCLYCNLKYRVKPNLVMIGASDIDENETRYFRMSAGRYNVIAQSGGGGGAAPAAAPAKKDSGGDKGGDKGGGLGDLAADLAGSADMSAGPDRSVDNNLLKSYFQDFGINFGAGSSISYDKPSSKLKVTNTIEELRKLETILKEIDVPVPLVLIESKLVEITVEDLEELGFNWTLENTNTNPNYMTADATKSPFGTVFELGRSVVNQSLVRHYGGAGNPASAGMDTAYNIINGLNIFPNFGPDGKFNISLSVTAIDQCSRGEVLSAPKVIALSGKTASIQLAQEMYFPESWNEPEVTSANNTYEYTPAYPDFGDAVPVGTTFKATPVISPNRHRITVTINPKITDLIRWSEYDYNILIGSVSATTAEKAYYPKIKMPVIGVREISTQVYVYDGETVVLGGILEEKASRIDDRYPILGDIPLIGRLFQSKTNNSKKTNLLMFITTRMLGYDGVPIKSRDNIGIFDFNR